MKSPDSKFISYLPLFIVLGVIAIVVVVAVIVYFVCKGKCKNELDKEIYKNEEEEENLDSKLVDQEKSNENLLDEAMTYHHKELGYLDDNDWKLEVLEIHKKIKEKLGKNGLKFSDLVEILKNNSLDFLKELSKNSEDFFSEFFNCNNKDATKFLLKNTYEETLKNFFKKRKHESFFLHSLVVVVFLSLKNFYILLIVVEKLILRLQYTCLN